MIKNDLPIKIQNVLTKKFDIFLKDNKNNYNKDFLEIIKDHIVNPGKCLRSILLIYAYKFYSNKRINKAIIEWASFFEIIQSFVLIHDDIADQSKTRRGKHTLHYELKNDKFKQAQNLALISGDLIYTYGLKSFLQINQKAELVIKSLDYLLNTAIKTAIGQSNELILNIAYLNKITKTDLLNLYIAKTAHYSFIAPLVCGFLMSGKTGTEIKILEKIGKYIGLAFQLKDDLLDIKKDSKKDIYSDIKNSKLTVLIFYIYQKANHLEKKAIKQIYQKKLKKTSELKQILELINKYQGINYLENLIDCYCKKAIAKIKNLSIANKSKKELIDFFLKNLDLSL